MPTNESKSDRQYLKVMTPDDRWIVRPDLMVLASIAHPIEYEAFRTYETLVAEEQSASPDRKFSEVGQLVLKKVLKKNSSHKAQAGEVVIELARIAAATGEPPAAKHAQEVAAKFHHKTFSTGTYDSALRDLRKHSSKYRNTQHVQSLDINPVRKSVKALFRVTARSLRSLSSTYME